MIKKTTTKNTRNYLEEVRKRLSSSNQKMALSVTSRASLHGTSPGRISAAVDLGYFEKTGKNGHYNTYKCNVPYFTLGMANEVIRHEYDKRQSVAEEKSIEPSVLKTEAELETGGKVGLTAIADWLRINGYAGIVYKGDKFTLL